MASKIQKIGHGGQILQDRRTEEYFFGQVNYKPICLLCNRAVPKFKQYNIKRHYVTNHAQNMTNLKINLERTRL